MKTKIKSLKQILAAALCVALISICSFNVSAQFTPSSIADDGPFTSASALRTINCDMAMVHHFLTQLIVWDGSTPTLGWDIGGTAGSIALASSAASKPDVCIVGPYAIVVYRDISVGVIADVYEFNGSGYIYLSSKSTVLSTGAGWPQIDSYGEDFVITWLDVTTSVRLATVAGDLSGSSGTPHFYATQNWSYNQGPIHFGTYPDVAIGTDMNGTPTAYYSYTEYPYALMVAEEKLSAIKTNTPGTIIPTATNIGMYYAYASANARIAAGYSNYADYAVVVNYNYEIHGYVSNNGTINASPYIYNNGSMHPGTDITAVPNYRPKVAYVYDALCVAWEVDNNSSGISSAVDGIDAIALMMDRDGYSNSTDYLIVNKTITSGDQTEPSLASDDKAIAGDDVMAAYHDFTQGYVYYKHAPCFVPGGTFRTETDVQTSLVAIYPNPFVDKLVINLPFNNESPASFKINITDALGKIVYQAATGNEKQIVWSAGNSINSGIYFLRVENTNGELITSSKISKQ